MHATTIDCGLQFALAPIARPCYTDDRFEPRGRLPVRKAKGPRIGRLAIRIPASEFANADPIGPSSASVELIRNPQSANAASSTHAVVSSMRLERLEINGFKSFSDRSELAFDKGVTAIVGPNGCGKSNVADAITWVMGEQSAKSLRGEKMEDVIFSGSDARKPTGAAEVRLRFSGVLKTVTGPAFPTEPAATATRRQRARQRQRPRQRQRQRQRPWQWPRRRRPATAIDAGIAPGDDIEAIIQSVAREVEVTRRLYRSGESEYLIDGQICRLRDIHELLMDTGLGAKAYAIIEQGKIGLILSSRPTDRRQLIEEAAGITKYKARRRAAELKLEAAQQNLTRIDDIVFEVEKQRGTLKRQAAKARRYQRLRDELRRWEKVLFARRYRQLAETIESARGAAGRRARARGGRRGAGRPRSSAISDACASSWPRPSRARPRRARRRTRASSRSTGGSSRSRSTASRSRRSTRAPARSPPSSTALDARREPARALLAARREAAADGERASATARPRRWPPSRTPTKRRTARSRGSRPTSRRRAARCSRRSTRRPRCATRSSTPRRRASASPRRCRSSTSRSSDVRIESERVGGGSRARPPTACAARTTRSRRRASRGRRANRSWPARASSTSGARASVRAREHELAGLEARLQVARGARRRARRLRRRARARCSPGQRQGRPAGRGRRLPRSRAGYERAVEACLGDLLQHVVVERPEHAAAGLRAGARSRRRALRLPRDLAASAGSGGFFARMSVPATPAGLDARRRLAAGRPVPDGVVALSSVVRVNGPFAGAIRRAIGDAWIAPIVRRARRRRAG